MWPYYESRNIMSLKYEVFKFYGYSGKRSRNGGGEMLKKTLTTSISKSISHRGLSFDSDI